MSYNNIGGGSKGEAQQDAEGGNSFLSSFKDRMKSLVPENVNFDLLNPRSSQPLSERAFLASEYTQPWSVFFSLGEFNFPPSFEEFKIRFKENIGLYFYNYFFIALIYLCLYTFLNFRSMLVITAVLALLVVFYEIHPDDFEFGDSFRIGTNTKAVLSIIAVVLAFIYGKLLILIGSFIFFLVVVVGVHATIREHAT